MLKAVKMHGFGALVSVSESLLSDKEFVLEVVKMHGHWLFLCDCVKANVIVQKPFTH
jgi:hypothetical protein